MGAVERLAGSPHWRAADRRRISPGGLSELGLRTWLMSKAGGRLMGVDDVRLLQTLGKHRSLFHGYLRFASRLVTFGRLPRADVELVTLRTAWNVGSSYEFVHHAHLSRLSGLSIETVERVARGPAAVGWTERQAALLAATDELHEQRMISEGTWSRLAEFLDQSMLAELCMLVGHYEMVGMFLKSAGVVPEEGAWQRGPLRWVRPDDDSDAFFPRWAAHLNRQLTRPLMSLGLPLMPPYAVIVHRGRRSGREYRTPVLSFVRDDLLIVPLGHGDRADWVKNLLAAGRGGVERAGRLRRITDPRITDAASVGDLLPAPARPVVRSLRLLVARLDPRP